MEVVPSYLNHVSYTLSASKLVRKNLLYHGAVESFIHSNVSAIIIIKKYAIAAIL